MARARNETTEGPGCYRRLADADPTIRDHFVPNQPAGRSRGGPSQAMQPRAAQHTTHSTPKKSTRASLTSQPLLPTQSSQPSTARTTAHLCCVNRSSLLKMPTVRSPSSFPALMIRTAISPRLAARTDLKGMSNLLPSPAVCTGVVERWLLLAAAAATTGWPAGVCGRFKISTTEVGFSTNQQGAGVVAVGLRRTAGRGVRFQPTVGAFSTNHHGVGSLVLQPCCGGPTASSTCTMLRDVGDFTCRHGWRV